MRRLLFFALPLLLSACAGVELRLTRVERVDPAAAAALIADGAYVLDVRPEDRALEGLLPSAVLIPWHELSAERLKDADQESPILVYDEDGSLSGHAARFILGWGWRQVYELEGGVEAWRRAGKRVVRPTVRLS